MSRKSNLYVLVAVIIAAVVIYFLSSTNSATAEALFYELNDAPVEVTLTSSEFDYTAQLLLANAEECGSDKDLNYFNELTDKFSSAQKEVYTFTYTEESQSPESYIVTVLPNVANYQTLDEFKADFDLCFAGGQEYPTELSETSLMFTSSCGSGFDDGSGNPIGCSEIINSVEISLN